MALLASLVTAAAEAHHHPKPERIEVPAALWRRSRTLEPSGVVWSAALRRFLVVSDDTGDSGNHHQPWLLAMTPEGAFDEEPVPLLGIDEVNDGESICAGPHGQYFMTTSHSLNLRQQEVASRQMLMLLRLEGRALRVVGRVDLTKSRGADGRATLLEIAGLPARGRLDIEAVTYRDGALLIGLKSPLTADERAVVLRLEHPVEAVKAGRIPPGALTPAWTLSLHVTKRNVPEGIADLTSLPDGSMVAVANAPKGGADDGGGSLYWFRPPRGEARLVRHFKELRPEGVTLDERREGLVIVFDNNDGPPMWVRWPLPPEGLD